MAASDRSVDRDSHVISRLLSATVLVRGTVYEVREKNPFTKATKEVRNRMFLLKPVRIAAEITFDHLWVFGFRSNRAWKVGDVVEFTARLSTYEHKGDVKFAAVAPYRNVSVVVSA